MQELPENKNLSRIETQRNNVFAFYDQIAPNYESQIETKVEYQVPKILSEIYKKYGIESGTILDVGCGTGKLREYLGDTFSYQGVDLSQAMIGEAKKRGYKGYVGPIEEIIKTFSDKSVDHITALSSIYFIEDLESLLKEFERVAKVSIFLTLEQFSPKVIAVMEEKGIKLYNHSFELIKNPTEVLKNVFLWKRPVGDDKIFGEVVFKKF